MLSWGAPRAKYRMFQPVLGRERGGASRWAASARSAGRLCLERWAGARHERHRAVLGSVSGENSLVPLQISLFPWLWFPKATDSGAVALWWLQPANSYPNLPERYTSILFRRNLSHNPGRLFFPALDPSKRKRSVYQS